MFNGCGNVALSLRELKINVTDTIIDEGNNVNLVEIKDDVCLDVGQTETREYLGLHYGQRVLPGKLTKKRTRLSL